MFFKLFRIITFMILIGTVIIISCEVILFFIGYEGKKYIWEKQIPFGVAAYDKLIPHYKFFAIQCAHPLYTFMFCNSDERIINNEVVSVTKSGFRGWGIEEKPPKKLLAIVTGGSTAFGQLASSNNYTLAGQLNNKQSKLFFLNAGVPSWTSTQEVYRYVTDLYKLKPELLISYSGANDGIRWDEGGNILPYGTNEGYLHFRRWVTNIRANYLPLDSKSIRATIYVFTEKYFHRTKRFLKEIVRPQEFISKTTAKEKFHSRDKQAIIMNAKPVGFADNMKIMHELQRSFGGSFIAVIQPHLSCHEKMLNKNIGDYPKYFKDQLTKSDLSKRYKFCRELYAKVVLELKKRSILYIDQSSLFDTAEEPLGAYFTDNVHLTDRGFSIAAEDIIKKVNQWK